MTKWSFVFVRAVALYVLTTVFLSATAPNGGFMGFVLGVSLAVGMFWLLDTVLNKAGY